MENHLTGLPFITNVSKEAGGINKDGKDAFNAYCEASGLTSFQHYEVEIQKLIKDWDAVESAALSLLNIMEALTTGLWKKIDQKKKEAKKAAKKKEFLGICKIDSANQKLDDAMEVDGEDHDTVKGMIGKRFDKKISKAKAKDKKEKRKKLFGQRKKPSAGARKNWSEWCKKCDRRWERRALSIKK